jgi:pantoate--beta-alanine ligase
MNTIKSIQGLSKFISQNKEIAFVPTMGNLHDGHLTLVRKARSLNKLVVVSIFVNEIQFNSSADFKSYPRTLKEDLIKLQKENVDIVFVPNKEEMNTINNPFTFDLKKIKHDLCDKNRPGHFEGVISIVARFCNIIRPSYLLLGKKDYQQLFILKKFLNDFCYPIKVLAVNTEREKSGLAMSSRNSLIAKKNLPVASMLYQELNYIKANLKSISDLRSMEQKVAKELQDNGWKVEYVSIRSQKTLLAPQYSERKLVALVAAYLGKVRLIDNIEFCI